MNFFKKVFSTVQTSFNDIKKEVVDEVKEN
jgi:hypothetical protein